MRCQFSHIIAHLLLLVLFFQLDFARASDGFTFSIVKNTRFHGDINPVHFRNLSKFSSCDTSFFGATIGIVVNFSTAQNSSHIQLNASLGFTQVYGDLSFGLNLALNAANGGQGLPSGQRGNGIRGNLVGTASLTVGNGKASDFIPVNTMNLATKSSVYQNHRYSFTSSQNFVLDSKGLNQRIASTGLRINNVDFHIYNDAVNPQFLLFGDGNDEGITGGGYLTVHNVFGNPDLDLTIGNDVFTGRSIRRTTALDFPFLTPSGTYKLYANQTSFDPAANPGYNELLNLGRTYISMNYEWANFIISHGGTFDMFTQNYIHDNITIRPPIIAPDGSLITTFHHFRSTTPNQWIFSGGAFHRN